MNFEYSVSYDESLVNVATQGGFDYLGTYEMWRAVVAACKENGCYNVLGESRLTAPIPLVDAYEHLNLVRSVGVTPDYRIAWVAKDPSVLERLSLAIRGSIQA